MKIEEGAFVRHISKPEWGVGKIQGINGDSVFVRFSDQLKTLKMAFAEKLLEPASADEFGARTTSRGGPAVGRITPCGVCAKTLDKARRSFDGAWKVCVRCSMNDGTEHVFYPYPDAFGATEGQTTADESTVTQSDCTWCRSGQVAASGTSRRCAEMEPTRA